MGEATRCSFSSWGTGADWAAGECAGTISAGLCSPAGCGTFAGVGLDGSAGSPAPFRKYNRKPPRSSSNSLNSFFETSSISSLISVRLGYSPTSFSAPVDGRAFSAGPTALPGLFAGVVVVLFFVIKLKPQPGDAPHG